MSPTNQPTTIQEPTHEQRVQDEEEEPEDSQIDEDDDEEVFLQHIDEELLHQQHPDDEDQPKDAAHAPRLLQDALLKGAVQPDASEEEEDNEEEKKDEKDSTTESNDQASEGPSIHATTQGRVPSSPTSRHVTHARANQLDFLLSKASEYSNFIAADLEDLQRSMAEEAKRKMEEESAEASAKTSKRPTKKMKINGAVNLKSAQEQHQKHHSNRPPIFIQPKTLAKECILKDYQLEGVRWLTSLFENGVSGILADEMGLGKTIQVIAMIAHLRSMQVPGPYLIVAPLATLPNWIREFQKWLPSLNVVRYHGTGLEREAMLAQDLNPKNKKNADFPAIVTSYEVAIKDEKKLNRIGEYTYLVVDEGQRLKNHRCTLIQSLKRIRAANRLLLSGTPIQNNLDECKCALCVCVYACAFESIKFLDS